MMLNIFEYLENTAQRLPEKAALVCEKRTVSFAELYEDALSIGRGIAEAAPLPSLPPFCRPVFVMTARSADCVLGFLGALASGNFYVPIDTSMPAARMEKIFRVMKPSCVVGTKDELDAVSGVFKGAALIDSAKAAGTPCSAGEVRSL